MKSISITKKASPRPSPRAMAAATPAPAAHPAYDPIDTDEEEAWLQGVLARGNAYDVRRGAEVNPQTGEIVSLLPTFYRKV